MHVLTCNCSKKYKNMLYMINFSFYVTWLYANMFGESINKLKLKLNLICALPVVKAPQFFGALLIVFGGFFWVGLTFALAKHFTLRVAVSSVKTIIQ